MIKWWNGYQSEWLGKGDKSLQFLFYKRKVINSNKVPENLRFQAIENENIQDNELSDNNAKGILRIGGKIKNKK